jgi:hypothetical protein
VVLEGTEVSEERIAAIIRETRIGELGTRLVVTRKRSMLGRNAMSVLTRATLRNIQEDGILLYSSIP